MAAPWARTAAWMVAASSHSWIVMAAYPSPVGVPARFCLALWAAPHSTVSQNRTELASHRAAAPATSAASDRRRLAGRAHPPRVEGVACHVCPGVAGVARAVTRSASALARMTPEHWEWQPFVQAFARLAPQPAYPTCPHPAFQRRYGVACRPEQRMERRLPRHAARRFRPARRWLRPPPAVRRYRVARRCASGDAAHRDAPAEARAASRLRLGAVADRR